MAQHDYSIANASGASVRADLNNVLAAIKSSNSGNSAPSPVEGMLWFDTAKDALKIYVGNAWQLIPTSLDLPIGIVCMWEGSVVPSKWALCDGTPKTAWDGTLHTPPDISDRFILATTDLTQVNQTGGSSTTSSNGAHTHGLSGLTIGETTLTESQMPGHRHTVPGHQSKSGNSSNSGAFFQGNGDPYTSKAPYGDNFSDSVRTSLSTATGGSQSHTHSVSGGSVSSSGAHTHTLTPPYYKLAFIAYIG